MDIYWAHVAQHQRRWRYDWDGNRVEDIFDPLAQVAQQTKRYRCTTPRTATGPQEQPGVGNGYDIVPFGDPQRHRLPHVLREHGRKGPQPELRAGQRPGRQRRAGTVAPPTVISAVNMTKLRG